MILDRLLGRRWSTLTEPSEALRHAFGGGRSTAGEDVTSTSSLGLSVYYACLCNISEDMGKLPLIVYKRKERGKERAKQHRNYKLLHDMPNPEMTAMTLRETITAWALGWGNGYAEIERNGRGEAVALWPVHPSRVTLKREDKALVYEIQEGGTPRRVAPRNMLHIHGMGDDGLTGHSVFRVGCESIGRGLAAQRFSGAFFGNNAQLGTTFEHPGVLGEAAYKQLKESLVEEHATASKAFRPRILEEGMKVSAAQVGIPPNDAQLIETMEFSVEDVCRWFRMPPQKVGQLKRAAGWSTLEMLNTAYVIDTLTPWAVRWEQELARKVFFPGEKTYYAEHLFDGLMRGDSKARSEYYSKQFATGAMSIDDINEAENRNPIEGPGGDTRFVPMNLTPLGQAIEKKEPQPSPFTPEPDAPKDKEDVPEGEEANGAEDTD